MTLGSGNAYLYLYNSFGNYLNSEYEASYTNKAQFSYLATSSGTYYLRASELGDDLTGTYNVKVSKIGNTAPIITSTATGTVTENAVTSTVIYKATASDADTNSTLAYSLSGTEASLLNIDSSTGNVTLKSPSDYETKNSYSFNVIASDGTLSSSKEITVNVTNVNEYAPTSANKTITIKEDTSKVLTLTDFAFSDADANTTLSKVKITSLETKGTLKLNGVNVTLNQEILAADIKAGKLVFTPISNENGTLYSNFKFQVSDESLYSLDSYTTTFRLQCNR